VVFTGDQSASAHAGKPLLGLFASEVTFREGTAAAVAAAGGLQRPGAPDWDVTVATAKRRLAGDPRGYLLVANHEATGKLGGGNTPDLLRAAAVADHAWLLDISYVATCEGWLYLAVVLDLATREVVSWAVHEHMRTELTLAALVMAVQ
jgi:transposase InsO family protein